MRILFVSQYFFPEEFKGNDIVFELAKRGHLIDVLTGIPNYPKGKFSEGFGFFKNNDAKISENINVFRTKVIPRGNNFISLMLNYISFPLFSYFKIRKLRKDYDVILVQQLSPVMMVFPALWMKKKIGKPLVTWVLDLWPESLVATTPIKKGFIINLLNKLVKKLYKESNILLISSKFFRKVIIEKSPNSINKIKYFPNWAEDHIANNHSNNDIDFSQFSIPDGYNIMFAGNIGDAQDFENILNAAKLSENDGVNWLILGDGRKLSWVKKEIENKNLKNVFLLGRYPLEMMPSFFKKANAMLVSLKNEPIYAMTVPAKVQAYMSCGKIVFGMLDGEGKDLINKSKIGVAVSAGNYHKLIEDVRMFKNLSKEEICEIEANSLKLYNENFKKEKLINELEVILKNVSL